MDANELNAALFDIPALIESIQKPSKIDVLFIPGRAEGDWEHESSGNDGILWTSTRVGLFRNQDYTIIIPGHDGSYNEKRERMEHGYPGYEAWRDELLQNMNLIPNVPDRILPCVIRWFHSKTTHTLEECDGFFLQAKKQKSAWKTVAVLAHKHQLPRILACMLKAKEVLKYTHSIDIYPLSPAIVDWNREVYDSLGQQKLPRWQHVEEEKNFMIKYAERGWMVPIETIRSYLQSLCASSLT